MRARNVIGCMSGTSMDAIDAALVRIDGTGLSMSATPQRFASRPLGELAARLRALAAQERMTTGEIAALSRDFSIAHVAAIEEVGGSESVDLIAVHGQTVFHAPPLSWQLLTPAAIVEKVTVPLIFDMRAADLAAGGQGAPITPLADWVLFRDSRESRVVLNLGGFSNFTYLPRADEGSGEEQIARIQGGDLCICNQLLDKLAVRFLRQPFDRDGAAAASGTANIDLLADLCASLRTGRAGRSLGTAEEPHQFIRRLVENWSGRIRCEDFLATTVEAIAVTIARDIPKCDHLLLAGGGAGNLTLVRRLGQLCSSTVSSTAAGGVAAAEREAAAMAILGALCQDRVPITLPQITGARVPAPLAGSWIFPNALA